MKSDLPLRIHGLGSQRLSSEILHEQQNHPQKFKATNSLFIGIFLCHFWTEIQTNKHFELVAKVKIIRCFFQAEKV